MFLSKKKSAFPNVAIEVILTSMAKKTSPALLEKDLAMEEISGQLLEGWTLFTNSTEKRFFKYIPERDVVVKTLIGPLSLSEYKTEWSLEEAACEIYHRRM